MIERRHASPYFDGRLVEAEKKPPATYGADRRCASCQAKVSRYTPPVPGREGADAIRCGLCWDVPDEMALTVTKGGKLTFSPYQAEKPKEKRDRRQYLRAQSGPPCSCHGEPTRVDPRTGKRICRVLEKARNRRYIEKQKAARLALAAEEEAA